MKPIYLKILSVILILLVIVATDSVWMPYIQSLPFFNSADETKPFQNLDQVTQITLSDEDANTVTLQQQDGVWQVDDNPVDTDKLNQFLNQIDSIQTLDRYIVSTNPDNYGNFRVSDQEGIRIQLQWPDQEKALILGDTGQQANTVHVRINDRPEVFLIPSNLTNLASTTSQDWRDKTITNLSPDQISSITYQSPSTELVLTKQEDNKWQAQSGQESTTLDTVTQERLLQALQPLAADTFATPEQIDQFNNSFSKTTISILDNQQELLVQMEAVQVENSDNWLIKSDRSDTVYIIDDTAASALILNPQDLF